MKTISIFVQPYPISEVYSVWADMISLSKQLNLIVETKINGVHMLAGVNDTVPEMQIQYEKGLKRNENGLKEWDKGTEPFMPRPILSDRIDRMANQSVHWVQQELRDIAKEVRKLESINRSADTDKQRG